MALLSRDAKPETPDTKQRYANSPTAWVGILHGCLKSRTVYNEATAWAHWIPATA
jgi:hypothetical protein